MHIKSIAAFMLGLSLGVASIASCAAPRETPIRLETGNTRGILALPDREGAAPILLLVAEDVANDALRPLALELAAQGVASLRYEGHGADAWIARLKADPRFDKVVVVGYGASLPTALQAANRVGAGGFVALAGTGGQGTPAEFGKLHMHARIIQGDADAQVGVDEARKLEQGRPGTPVVIVKGMNHELRFAQGNAAVAPELVTALVAFASKR